MHGCINMVIADRYIEIEKILNEVKVIINSPNTDVLWSGYNTVAEVLRDIDLYIEKIKRHDDTVIEDLMIAFAPTGAFQEISLSSGWGYEFIEISSRLDDLIDDIRL